MECFLPIHRYFTDLFYEFQSYTTFKNDFYSFNVEYFVIDDQNLFAKHAGLLSSSVNLNADLIRNSSDCSSVYLVQNGVTHLLHIDGVFLKVNFANEFIVLVEVVDVSDERIVAGSPLKLVVIHWNNFNLLE